MSKIACPRSLRFAFAAGAAIAAFLPAPASAQFRGYGSSYGGQAPWSPPRYPGLLDETGPRPGKIAAPKRRSSAPILRGVLPQAKRVQPAPAAKGAPLVEPKGGDGDIAVAKPTVAPPVKGAPLNPPAEKGGDIAVAKPTVTPPAKGAPLNPPAEKGGDVAVAKPMITPPAVAPVPISPPSPAVKDTHLVPEVPDPGHPVPVIRQIQIYPAGTGAPALPPGATPP